MTTLLLYDRPAEGTSARLNLQGMYESWRRTKRAIGGYHTGRFTVKQLGMPQLTDFYNTWIGMKIVENTFGITSYEGIIWQLDLIKNGINYRRTLNPKYWQNRVKVIYTDGDGEQQTIDYSENTDSSDIFGEMEYQYVIGGASSAGATALQTRALVDYAWPKSRTVGSVSVGEPSPLMRGDGLYVTTAGFWTTMNWEYRESMGTAGASTLITTLVGETEFVTAGRIETNALSIGAESMSKRNGDIIEDIINQGDASGNVWKGGVYADKKLVYEPAPTTIDYILRNGALYDKAGVVVDPALINPGFYVRDTNAPMGMQPPGTSNIFDDPQVSYCDEVEFIWPDTLRLKFPGEAFIADVVSGIPREGSAWGKHGRPKFSDLYESIHGGPPSTGRAGEGVGHGAYIDDEELVGRKTYGGGSR